MRHASTQWIRARVGEVFIIISTSGYFDSVSVSFRYLNKCWRISYDTDLLQTTDFCSLTDILSGSTATLIIIGNQILPPCPKTMYSRIFKDFSVRQGWKPNSRKVNPQAEIFLNSGIRYNPEMWVRRRSSYRTRDANFFDPMPHPFGTDYSRCETGREINSDDWIPGANGRKSIRFQNERADVKQKRKKPSSQPQRNRSYHLTSGNKFHAIKTSCRKLTMFTWRKIN